LNYKNLYNSNLKKIANNLLEKIVLLISVLNAIACDAITVKNYHFMWCSLVINVMFNTQKLLSIISERIAENKRMRENDRCMKVICIKLFRKNCMKIITIGQIFLSNYE
jgi:hypothetical protein